MSNARPMTTACKNPHLIILKPDQLVQSSSEGLDPQIALGGSQGLREVRCHIIGETLLFPRASHGSHR